MTALSKLTIIIIEPNTKLIYPYDYLSVYNTIRVSTLQSGMKAFAEHIPSFIFLSATFAPIELINFLEFLKDETSKEFIPIIIVVDLGYRVNFIPGISWGKKIAVVDCSISHQELELTMDRVLLP